MQTISPELKSTVAANPHIQKVHFTKSGEHYFNAHELKGKSYGRLALKPVHSGNDGDRKIYKNKPVAIDELEIVETVDREDILATETKETKKK